MYISHCLETVPISFFWYPLSAGEFVIFFKKNFIFKLIFLLFLIKTAISAAALNFLVGLKMYPFPFACYLLCGAASLPTSFPVLFYLIPKENRTGEELKKLIGPLKVVHNTIPFVIFASLYRAAFIKLQGTYWQVIFSFILPLMKFVWIRLGIKECPNGVGNIGGQSFIVAMTYCFSSLLFIHIDSYWTFIIILLQQNIPWLIQWR